MTTTGYGRTIAKCERCDTALDKAPARHDGEDTFSGYLPCVRHPRSGIRYCCVDCGKRLERCTCDKETPSHASITLGGTPRAADCRRNLRQG